MQKKNLTLQRSSKKQKIDTALNKSISSIGSKSDFTSKAASIYPNVLPLEISLGHSGYSKDYVAHDGTYYIKPVPPQYGNFILKKKIFFLHFN